MPPVPADLPELLDRRGRRDPARARPVPAQERRATTRREPATSEADPSVLSSGPAEAFDNPDYVDVVLHSYRHRLGQAPGDPAYDAIEERLAALPPITVPAVTLDGLADGNFPATDGSPSAAHLTGPRVHHQVPDAGHNLPQEAPEGFAAAVLEVAGLSASSARR